MTTARDIITDALKDIGVLAAGESASAADASDALATLNQLLGQWQAQKLYVTGQQDVSFTPDGSQTYSIGTGATINTTLPVSIDAAFWRYNNVDYPISVLSSFEDYETITLKTLAATVPSVLFYRRNYPQGTIYIWPQPTTGTVHLVMRDVLSTFSGLSSDVSLPAEYAMALRYSLAELLAPMFGMSLSADVVRLAARARKVVKRANLDIPTMGQPQETLNNGRFSIYTGH